MGLAVARELAQDDPDLVLVDKEPSFGRHTSSRNSEVIHAGHYYQPGSLKARLCAEGNSLLYNFLESNALPHKKTGKIIVATNEAEISVLNKYMELGTINGVPDMRMMSKAETQALEPRVKCVAGLHLPSTGIFDTHAFMQCLEQQAEKLGAFVVYGMEVTQIQKQADRYLVSFTNGDVFECEQVLNCAGLWADQVAQMAGIDLQSSSLKQHWCKGEYYKSTKIKDIKHLIYPVADPAGIFLGIHLTLNLNGEVRFGPNAFYVDRIDYQFEDKYLEDFHVSVNRYLDVPLVDLEPDDTGIRAKLQGPEDGFRDFYIQEESSHGLCGLVNLIGIESPGLTASLAIARHVAALLKLKRD